MGADQQLTESLVVTLREVSASDADRVGTKAANLASLLRAGFPVPAGAVLTTDAYSRFIEYSQPGSEATQGSSSSAAVPDDVQTALAETLSLLGPVPLAVRSSSAAEDLSGASFAGQYETVLSVTGLDGLKQAVLRCWASASSRHVDSYRESRGLEGAPMAVLIQRMVDPEAAGVAFSADPVTGSRKKVVVNALRGLGERLVSGEVSPDQWVVMQGVTTRETSPEGAIDEDQALAIAQVARRAEAHFGAPQDIEWAIEDGRLYLLQARPITSLPEPPVEPIPVEIDVPSGFWQHDASHSPRPVYPIERFVYPLITRASPRLVDDFGYLFDGIEFRDIGGWTYLRIVPPGGREGPVLPKWVMWLLARTLPLLRNRLRGASEAVRSDTAGRFVGRWYDVWQPELDEAIFAHLDVDLMGLSDAELDDHIESTLGLVERGIEVHSLLTGALAIVMYDTAMTCEVLLGWDLARTMDLVSGTSYKSTEPARRLHELAQMASSRPAVRELLDRPAAFSIEGIDSVDEEFGDAVKSYLHRYGSRVLGYGVADPTLTEVPAFFTQLIRGQLEQNYRPDVDQQTAADVRTRSADEARKMLADRPEDLARFDETLRKAERAYPVREDNEFFTISAPLAVMRYAILEVGRRLAERGVIRRPDDVRFLELDEARPALIEGGDKIAGVEHRKGQWAWAELNPGPSSYGEAPPEPPALDFIPPESRLPMEAMLWSLDATMAIDATPGESSEGSLSGIAASPGRYTGPVRIVTDETHFDKLQPGDVLVCPITSPVWSVVFPLIGALVTDTGGVLSHPAIIAREYQIPAVVATGHATALVHDGDLVTVDGSAGVVTVVDPREGKRP